MPHSAVRGGIAGLLDRESPVLSHTIFQRPLGSRISFGCLYFAGITDYRRKAGESHSTFHEPLAPLSKRMVRGGVLAALDSPIVREESMWPLTPRCRSPWICRLDMDLPFERTGEATCFLQATPIGKPVRREVVRLCRCIRVGA